MIITSGSHVSNDLFSEKSPYSLRTPGMVVILAKGLFRLKKVSVKKAYYCLPEVIYIIGILYLRKLSLFHASLNNKFEEWLILLENDPD